MTATLALIAHVVIIGAVIVRVLLRPGRDPASRVAWILFIATLPIVGAVAYVLLGEVHPGGHPERRGVFAESGAPQAGRDVSSASGKDDEGEHRSGHEREHERADASRLPQSVIAGFAAARSISGYAPVGGNIGVLLADSNTTIEAMVADIDAATDHVHLLFYIWLADGNGGRMADAMTRAATRGVTCRVVVDDLGSRAFINSEHWAAMDRAGVHLARAQPLRRALRHLLRGRLDVRNHRKIVVIDDRITFCGSQNCADPEFAVKPKYAPWVDAVVRFEGPIARQNQRLFLQDWRVYTGEHVDELLQRPVPERVGPIVAQVIGTGPDSRYSAMPEMFSTLMHAARRELIISTPYYVPDESMQAALCASARRGVDTTIVVPARNDSPFVAAASRSYYPQLLEAGVCIHEFNGGLLHTKTLTVDGNVSLIGSANMDRRSFDLNYENNILLHDKALTQDIRARQHTYIASSTVVSAETVEAWSWHHRLRNNAMAIMGPVL